MPSVTLNAHFNGQQIVLDEAFDLPENAKLLVTILETPDLGHESKLDLAMNILEHVLVAKPPFAKPANIIDGIPFELAAVRPSGFPHMLKQ